MNLRKTKPPATCRQSFQNCEKFPPAPYLIHVATFVWAVQLVHCGLLPTFSVRWGRFSCILRLPALCSFTTCHLTVLQVTFVYRDQVSQLRIICTTRSTQFWNKIAQKYSVNWISFVWRHALKKTNINEVFSDYQPCLFVKSHRRFRAMIITADIREDFDNKWSLFILHRLRYCNEQARQLASKLSLSGTDVARSDVKRRQSSQTEEESHFNTQQIFF
jgi:hypothetical protein